MKPVVKAVITAALVAGLGGAGWLSFNKSSPSADSTAGKLLGVPQAVELSGLVALDVEPYFADARVKQILSAQGITLKLARVGSREMAARVVPGQTADFYFPSGVVAANQITDAAKKANLSAGTFSPFYTPMVIASWEPIAKILAANGMAKEAAPKVWHADLDKLTQAMLAKRRWKDLKDAGAYEVNKSILVSTTDVRKSNSAAMYLALTSYAANGGEVVSDKANAQKSGQRLSELFKRQGFQENYVNGNFDDYVSIGIGKAPMAFMYENQLLSYALTKKGVGDGMVLIYPQPTIFNKVVFVSLNERSKKLGELLSTHPELQRLAIDYGFRTADTAQFAQVARSVGLSVDERITQIIDPPSFEIMAEMIEAVAKEMSQ